MQRVVEPGFMTVYRIQLKENRMCGAYCVRYRYNRPNIVKALHKAHDGHKDNNHPSPYKDCNHRMQRNEFSGCVSAADLLRWFKGFIPDLLQAGYEIVALTNVTITAVGEYQVLFTWND